VAQDKDKWRTLPKTVANKSLSFRKDEKFLDHLCDYGSSQRLLRRVKCIKLFITKDRKRPITKLLAMPKLDQVILAHRLGPNIQRAY
jgi:hypothetical protein